MYFLLSVFLPFNNQHSHPPTHTHTHVRRLKELMKCQQSLAKMWGEVLMARLRVKLMRQAYETEKTSQQHGNVIS